MSNAQSAIPTCRDDELWSLCSAMCDGTIGEAGLVRLESLLEADPAGRLFCASYLRINGQLMRMFRPITPCVKAEDEWRRTSADPSAFNFPSVPIFTFFGNTIHGTIGYFSQGMPLAYLLATVITGLGLLIGSLIHVSGPEQAARNSVVVAPALVGRITGMVDCQWEKEGSEARGQSQSLPSPARGRGAGGEGGESPTPHPQSLVALGDKFALASGLMEITYDTGAKVILQGPVTYEVDSNGGYLSVGKLAGKLEKKNDECRMVNGELRTQLSGIHPSSFILHPFVVRTPTATVTDLGTEFGVEVNSEGVTETQVFTGSVKVASFGDQNNSSREQTVRAGSELRIDAQGNRLATLQSSEGRFVRTLRPYGREAQADVYAELVLSMKPFAYYRMERPKDDKNRNTIFDSGPDRHHGALHLADEFGGDPWRTGRFGGAVSSIARDRSDYIDVPNFPGTNSDQLSVFAWVNAFAADWPAMIACEFKELILGRKPQKDWQFVLDIGSPDGDLEAIVNQGNGFPAVAREGASKPLPLGQWQHVGFVADGLALRLYRNGVEVASMLCHGVSSSPPIKHMGIGCMCYLKSDEPMVTPRHFLLGRIDELAIFYHALSPGQIKQLWKASSGEPVSQLIGRKVKP